MAMANGSMLVYVVRRCVASHRVPSSARFVALGNYARGTGCIHVHSLEGGQIKSKQEVRVVAPIVPLVVLPRCCCARVCTRDGTTGKQRAFAASSLHTPHCFSHPPPPITTTHTRHSLKKQRPSSAGHLGLQVWKIVTLPRVTSKATS